MREMNDDYNDETYPAEIQMEIGGTPSWYSTCDNNLLVYSVMSTVKQSSQAFEFLKEIQQTVERLYPNIDQEFEVIESLEEHVGSEI